MRCNCCPSCLPLAGPFPLFTVVIVTFAGKGWKQASHSSGPLFCRGSVQFPPYLSQIQAASDLGESGGDPPHHRTISLAQWWGKKSLDKQDPLSPGRNGQGLALRKHLSSAAAAAAAAPSKDIVPGTVSTRSLGENPSSLLVYGKVSRGASGLHIARQGTLPHVRGKRQGVLQGAGAS